MPCWGRSCPGLSVGRVPRAGKRQENPASCWGLLYPSWGSSSIRRVDLGRPDPSRVCCELPQPDSSVPHRLPSCRGITLVAWGCPGHRRSGAEAGCGWMHCVAGAAPEARLQLEVPSQLWGRLWGRSAGEQLCGEGPGCPGG